MFGKHKKRKTTKVDSLIGQHTRIVGDVHFCGGLHVDGTIKGNVIAEDTDSSVLTLSDRGTIEGEVRVPFIVLNGLVKGDVHVSQHAELAPNAKVDGDVYYALIEMAMGASVNGKLMHISDDQGPRLAIAHEGVAESADNS